MKRVLLILSGMLVTSVSFGAVKKFGSDITLKEPRSLTQAISSFEALKDQDILVDGVIERVCQKKGCWLTIKTDREDVRVGFKDYKFFIPMSLAGEKVRMQGRLEYKQVTAEKYQNFLRDGGASEAEIAAVKEPRMVYSFTAAGLEIGE